jgi:hypothetical protein
VVPKYNQQSHMRNPDDLRNDLFQKTFAVGGESPLLFRSNRSRQIPVCMKERAILLLRADPRVSGLDITSPLGL